MSYEFLQFRISDHMLDALECYVRDHIKPGGFLCAVISNDLCDTITRADDNNLANLPAFTAYLYNEAPQRSWGSPERLKAWINDKQQTN